MGLKRSKQIVKSEVLTLDHLTARAKADFPKEFAVVPDPSTLLFFDRALPKNGSSKRMHIGGFKVSNDEVLSLTAYIGPGCDVHFCYGCEDEIAGLAAHANFVLDGVFGLASRGTAREHYFTLESFIVYCFIAAGHWDTFTSYAGKKQVSLEGLKLACQAIHKSMAKAEKKSTKVEEKARKEKAKNAKKVDDQDEEVKAEVQIKTEVDAADEVNTEQSTPDAAGNDRKRKHDPDASEPTLPNAKRLATSTPGHNDNAKGPADLPANEHVTQKADANEELTIVKRHLALALKEISDYAKSAAQLQVWNSHKNTMFDVLCRSRMLTEEELQAFRADLEDAGIKDPN
ncbi:hypothetical protein CC80DRAFT_539791 [Byssothecium circinans]|uniref:Uncharacterized protein n=1 Tax=Byssothecium circinans TaxID=147558 RepID=A0A6A5TMH7_9PLEO|nr:hypothetical protein CC80DRAFT_539791 [Byssothecium circinans]